MRYKVYTHTDNENYAFVAEAESDAALFAQFPGIKIDSYSETMDSFTERTTMQAAFVSQQNTTGTSDFDRILQSISGGLHDYLGNRPSVNAEVVPPPPAAAASAGTTDFFFLALIALGVYALMR